MYGNDAWSIHKGSCGYGYIYPTDPLGWNVMAMPDVAPEYADSCGSCYEVKCDPSTFTDGYGQVRPRLGQEAGVPPNPHEECKQSCGELWATTYVVCARDAMSLEPNAPTGT